MQEEDIGERMDRDFQLASDFKDELIPMVYEYYLNVVEHGEIEESESDDEDDGTDKKGLDDFDSDGNPKQKSKK